MADILDNLMQEAPPLPPEVDALRPHRGHEVLLQRHDGTFVDMLLIAIYRLHDCVRDTWAYDLFGYEDCRLDCPITVPLADVVDWIGEDE